MWLWRLWGRILLSDRSLLFQLSSVYSLFSSCAEDPIAWLSIDRFHDHCQSDRYVLHDVELLQEIERKNTAVKIAATQLFVDRSTVLSWTQRRPPGNNHSKLGFAIEVSPFVKVISTDACVRPVSSAVGANTWAIVYLWLSASLISANR